LLMEVSVGWIRRHQSSLLMAALAVFIDGGRCQQRQR
jgi:hypothetical protein